MKVDILQSILKEFRALTNRASIVSASEKFTNPELIKLITVFQKVLYSVCNQQDQQKSNDKNSTTSPVNNSKSRQ
jgi:hypothetical protein